MKISASRLVSCICLFVALFVYAQQVTVQEQSAPDRGKTG